MNYLEKFFPEVEKIAENSSVTLRNEAMNFYKEAYKWLGEKIRPFLNKLKKAQIDELDKIFKDLPKTQMKPLLMLPDSDDKGQKGGAEETEFDLYDISQPVDIFTKYNEAWTEKVLGQPKWVDKKELLEEMAKAANAPKLAASNFFPIVSMLKKVMADPIIHIVMSGMKILGLLAKGLRKNFQAPSKTFFPLVLSKLKEKKPQIIEQSQKTLEDFLYSLTLEDMLSDILESFADTVSYTHLTLPTNREV